MVAIFRTGEVIDMSSPFLQRAEVRDNRLRVTIFNGKIVECNVVDWRGGDAEDVGNCIKFLESVKEKLEGD